MNLTLNIEGTFEELAFIMKAVDEKKTRERSLFDTMNIVPKVVPTAPAEGQKPKNKKHGIGTGGRKAVDILIGSVESGFAYYKTFDSVTAVAKHLGLSHPAIISPYIHSGQVYKKIYKFKFHD